jgi:hypothetical protein
MSSLPPQAKKLDPLTDNGKILQFEYGSAQELPLRTCSCVGLNPPRRQPRTAANVLAAASQQPISIAASACKLVAARAGGGVSSGCCILSGPR